MKPKRLLFGVLWPSPGGHTRTAVAVAETLRRRGHDIAFAVNAGVESIGVIQEAGFPVLRLSGLYADPVHRAFRRNLRDLARTGPYDAIHWFEKVAGVRDAAVVAAEVGRAFVWTLTSGGPPKEYFGINRVVVFTREVADDVGRRSPQTATHVVAARIDFSRFDDAFVRTSRSDMRAQLGIAESDLLVVRVARCSRLYLRSVRLGIALADRFTRAGRRAVFLHAGYVQDPEAADRIRSLVNEANAQAGRIVAHTVTTDVAVGTKYAAAADICLASGRSALEALAIGRPTLVVWGSRYLGLVDERSIGPLADTNFQGRGLAPQASDEAIVCQMHDAVSDRLADPDRAARVHRACSGFVETHYSLEQAADIYETLYEDDRISVASNLEYYANPVHLAHGLGRSLIHRYRNSQAVRFLKRVRGHMSASTDE